MFKKIQLVAILVLLFSCNKKEEKIENKIVVTKTLVCYAYSFGFVGSGSCLFHYSEATKGYLVQLKSGENVVNSTHCLPEQLDFVVEKMRYDFKQKDSIILLP